MRESDLVNELIRGMWPVVKLYRTNAGTFRSMDGKHIIHGLPRGFSDLFGVIPADKVADGRPMPVFLEAKIYPNKASPEQIAFLQEYRRAGCVAGVVYSLADAWKLIDPILKKVK